MKKKICNIAVASSLSIVATQAYAFGYTITNADGSNVDMNNLPGVTDLTVTAAPDMSYTVSNIGNLDTLVLGSGTSGSNYVGLGLTPTSTLGTLFANEYISGSNISNLNVNQMIIDNAADLSFGWVNTHSDGG